MGTTWAYPPPLPPPLIPKTGPIEGSRRQSITSFPIRPMPCAREIEVVVLPSPAFVGVMAVVMTSLPSGRSASRSRMEREIFALGAPVLLELFLEDPGVGGDVGDRAKDGLLRDLQPALHGLASRRRYSAARGRVRIPVPFTARATGPCATRRRRRGTP